MVIPRNRSLSCPLFAPLKDIIPPAAALVEWIMVRLFLGEFAFNFVAYTASELVYVVVLVFKIHVLGLTDE